MDILLTLLKESSVNFGTKERTLYNSAYLSIIRNLIKQLQNTNRKQNILEVYRKECKNFYNYAENRKRIHKNVLSDSILLWGMPNDANVKYCKELQFPITKIENISSLLRIFMAMKETYASFFGIINELYILEDDSNDISISYITT